MMNHQILVDVSPDGTVTIEAVGYRGKACEKATAAIEKALGVVKSSKKKPEYYATERNLSQQRVG